jgi:hypothetical protein
VLRGKKSRNKKLFFSEASNLRTSRPIFSSNADPPGAPKIQGLEDGEVLTAGNLKRLTCTSISGNPLATLRWFIGDKELNSIYVTRDNYASAEVSFVPKWNDNGAQVDC